MNVLDRSVVKLKVQGVKYVKYVKYVQTSSLLEEMAASGVQLLKEKAPAYVEAVLKAGVPGRPVKCRATQRPPSLSLSLSLGEACVCVCSPHTDTCVCVRRTTGKCDQSELDLNR